MPSLCLTVTRVAACVLLAAFVTAAAEPLPKLTGSAHESERQPAPRDHAMATFLDRLMRAESGGRDNAANPRSTALGPFQFIKSTFLYVTRRHFPGEIAGLDDDDILKLRTDRAFARRAAEAYTRDAAAHLEDQGLPTTMGNLRLAYLVGPGAAARLLQAPGETAAVQILGSKVVEANPFMKQMSAAEVIARAAADVAGSSGREVAAAAPARAPAVPVKAAGPSRQAAVKKAQCRPTLPSCRKFIALAEMRAKAQARKAEKSTSRKQA